MTAPTTYRNACCRLHPNEHDALRLWDGHTYCRRCVEEHSALLARSAADRGRLCDNLTLKDSVLWWQFPVCCVIAFGLVLTFAYFLMRPVFAEMLLLAGGFGSVMFPIYLAMTAIARPQLIEIGGGKVFYKTPLLQQTYKLSECTWDLDGRMEDSAWYPLSRLLSRTDAIVLRAGSRWNQVVVFCCVDGATRELWSAFLMFAAQRGTAVVSGAAHDSP